MGTVAVALVLAGVAASAAAWDRAHGRKDENWDEPTTIPTWANAMLVIGGIGMVVLSMGNRNWLGAGVGVVFVVLFVVRYRRSENG